MGRSRSGSCAFLTSGGDAEDRSPMPPLNRTDGGDKNTNTARNPSTEGFGIAVPDPSFIFPIHESSLPLKQRNRSRFGRKQGRCVGQAASRIFASSIERPLLLLRVCPKCTSLPTSLQSLSLHFREAEQKLAPDRIEDRREKQQLRPVCLGDQLGWN